MNRLAVSLVLASLLGLAACEGSGSGGGTTLTYTKLGFVGVSEAQVGGEPSTNVVAEFIEYEEALPAEVADDPYGGLEDGCTVYSSGEDVPVSDELPNPALGEDIAFTQISAGDTLSLSAEGTRFC